MAVTMVALMAVACGGKRIEGGVYHSVKGYRVTIPGSDWTVNDDGRADLELRHRRFDAGMLVNASCGGGPSRAPLTVLGRQLLSGLREREIAQQDTVTVNGRPAAHAVARGRLGEGTPAVEVEVYVVKDGACLYDFVYVADPSVFATLQPDFRRLVETLANEGR